MSDTAVEVKVEDRPEGGRIATVAIDNRHHLNCLSTPIIVRFAAVMSDLATDETLRAVVLTGGGRESFHRRRGS